MYFLCKCDRVYPEGHMFSDCRRRRDIMLRVLGVRLLSRLLVLVCSLSLLSLLFLSRCGFNNLDTDLIDTAGKLKLQFLIKLKKNFQKCRYSFLFQYLNYIFVNKKKNYHRIIKLSFNESILNFS